MADTDELNAFHACLRLYAQTPDEAARAEFTKQAVDHYNAAINAEPHRAIFPRKYTIDSNGAGGRHRNIRF